MLLALVLTDHLWPVPRLSTLRQSMFIRLQGVPIPTVFDLSSSASNQVGSEYIIMERVQRRELADTWYTMTFKERMAAVEKIVDVEGILFGVQFPANGSLFFKYSLSASVKSVDMPENNNLKDVGRFCVGPSTEYLWGIKSEMSSPPIADHVRTPICTILC
jgi:hypothetical protein